MIELGGPIVIAGGGTAGHILPGLAVVRALESLGCARSDMVWIGSRRGQETELVPPSGVELVALPGRGIQRRLTPANLSSGLGLMVAGVRAIALFGRRRPAVVLTLGGYASVAASVAAVLWRVPIIVAEQNAVAGAANRLIGRWAAACAVPFDGTGLPRAVLTGNPVRDMLLRLRPTSDASIADERKAARMRIGLDDVDELLLLVFAGSLGSRRINEAVAGFAATWAGPQRIRIHHVIGRRDFATFERPVVDPAWVTYEPVEYEEHMDRYLPAADLVLSRAGGTTVSELAVIGVGSILVPLPIAPGDHQRANARALVESGAARLLDDGDCTGPRLHAEIADIAGTPGRVDEMARAAWGLGRPDAATAIADIIVGHADRRRTRRRGGRRSGAAQ